MEGSKSTQARSSMVAIQREQAGTAYDQFVVDKNTKVERGLLHLELFTRSSNKWHQNKDGTDDDP